MRHHVSYVLVELNILRFPSCLLSPCLAFAQPRFEETYFKVHSNNTFQLHHEHTPSGGNPTSSISYPQTSFWNIASISYLLLLLSELHMAAPDTDRPAMFRRLLSSCFQKRPERLPSKSPHVEGATETDGSSVTLQPTEFSRIPQSSKDITVLKREEATENRTMPKPVKGTAAAKSSRKPYQKAGPTSKSDHKSVLVLRILSLQ